MKKTATVYDVAAHAGVSIATVSRVFRRPADVRESTRATVLESVRELGYVPSASARGLAARRTGVLGLYFPDFDADADDAPAEQVSAEQVSADQSPVTVRVDIPDNGVVVHTNLYFDEVLRGSEQQAGRDGFTLMVGVGRGSDPIEMVNDIAGRVDGLALLAQSIPAAVLEHVSRRIPIVLISGTRQGDEYDHISSANAEGMQALTRHVVDDLGVRAPMYARGPAGTADDDERYAGFCAALADSGIDPDSLPMVIGDFTREGGRMLAKKLLDAKELPRALLCANDQTALGVMDVLVESGIRIPEDVIVTGFDGIEEARLATPRLTTVQQPMVELGRTAMRMMRSRLDDPAQPPMSVRLPVTVLLRESSEGALPR
jgi:LacI family transcriptional regulator